MRQRTSVCGMPRRLRVHFSGAIYHVSFRGNERKKVIRDDRDRRRMLETLASQTKKHGVRMYLVCLMSNHVHLLNQRAMAALLGLKSGAAVSVLLHKWHAKIGTQEVWQRAAREVEHEVNL